MIDHVRERMREWHLGIQGERERERERGRERERERMIEWHLGIQGEREPACPTYLIFILGCALPPTDRPTKPKTDKID